MKTYRSQMIQRMRNSAQLVRGFAYQMPALSEQDRTDLYDVAQILEESAHRISLDDLSESTRELMLFAYALVGLSGAGIGVIATLLLT